MRQQYVSYSPAAGEYVKYLKGQLVKGITVNGKNVIAVVLEDSSSTNRNVRLMFLTDDAGYVGTFEKQYYEQIKGDIQIHCEP